jgi:hypothetical protein
MRLLAWELLESGSACLRVKHALRQVGLGKYLTEILFYIFILLFDARIIYSLSLLSS